LATPFLTTLLHKQELGSVRVTNPFHPFYNCVFPLIKTRKVAGTLTLILADQERGSFAIAATWTDYVPQMNEGVGAPDQFISVQALIALCQMCQNTGK
jgi:hypothetical protein